MKNVLEYLEYQEKSNSNKTAVVEEDKKCTYSELTNISKKIGSGLIRYVLPRNPVPILMEKGISALSTFFGAVYAGCFYVLLNPELPVTRLQKILEILDTNIIVTDERNKELANEIITNQKILQVEDLQKEEINEEKLKEIRNQTIDLDPLYANFTSGSTGIPKGVVIGHRSTIDFIDVFTKEFKINADDVIANQAPFDFDVSVKDIYSTIKTGATLVIVPKKLFSMPAKLLDYICDNNVTTMIWAVSALCLITTFHGLDYKVPTKVNKIIFSGEVMPLKHLKQWIKYLPNTKFINVYGPTEITCNCTYYIVDNKKEYETNIPIGKPFDNEQVFLLDENNKEITEPNISGEICVRGTALALGYYNNLEQTNDRFVQNPLNNKYKDLIYKTGDLGYFDENNLMYFSGRKDFQIKHMGHRIELEEIEMTMEKIDEIQRVCCIYKEEKSKLYGFYIGNISKEELHEKLKSTLPIFMIPNILMKLDEFPMTKNGKIDRKQLRELTNPAKKEEHN